MDTSKHVHQMDLLGANLFSIKICGCYRKCCDGGSISKRQHEVDKCGARTRDIDLVNCLNKMGARIYGAGTDIIEIEGVESLNGVDHTVISDRIEAGTFAIAAAMTNGDLTLHGVDKYCLESLVKSLLSCGVSVDFDGRSMRVISNGRPCSIDISTDPFPGFPTDLQAQFMSMMSISKGLSVFQRIFLKIGLCVSQN